MVLVTSSPVFFITAAPLLALDTAAPWDATAENPLPLIASLIRPEMTLAFEKERAILQIQCVIWFKLCERSFTKTRDDGSFIYFNCRRNLFVSSSRNFLQQLKDPKTIFLSRLSLSLFKFARIYVSDYKRERQGVYIEEKETETREDWRVNPAPLGWNGRTPSNYASRYTQRTSLFLPRGDCYLQPLLIFMCT